MAQLIQDVEVILYPSFITKQYEQPSSIDFNSDNIEIACVYNYVPDDSHEYDTDISATLLALIPATGMSSYRTYDSERVRMDNLIFPVGEAPLLYSGANSVTHLIIQRNNGTDPADLIAYVEVNLSNELDDQYVTWNPPRQFMDFEIPCNVVNDVRKAGEAKTGVISTAVALPERLNNIDLSYIQPSVVPTLDRMRDNLVWQFRDLQTIDALLLLEAEQIADTEQDVFDIQEALDLHTAVGAHLDILGEWVGRTRLKNEEDEEYRYEIYLQTLKNKNEGLLSEVQEIVDRSLLRHPEAGSYTVNNGYNATVDVVTDKDTLQYFNKYSLEEILPHSVGVNSIVQLTDNDFILGGDVIAEDGEVAVSVEPDDLIGEGLTSVDDVEEATGCYDSLYLSAGQYAVTSDILDHMSAYTIGLRINTLSNDNEHLSISDLKIFNDGSLLFVDVGGIQLSSITAVDTGENVDLAVVVNQDIASLYINGVEEDSQVLVTDPTISGQVYIGSELENTETSYSMFKLWSNTITPYQVTQLYNEGVGLDAVALPTELKTDLVISSDLISVNGELIQASDGGCLATVISVTDVNSDLVPFGLTDAFNEDPVQECDFLGLTTLEYQYTDLLTGQLTSL